MCGNAVFSLQSLFMFIASWWTVLKLSSMLFLCLQGIIKSINPIKRSRKWMLLVLFWSIPVCSCTTYTYTSYLPTTVTVVSGATISSNQVYTVTGTANISGNDITNKGGAVNFCPSTTIANSYIYYVSDSPYTKMVLVTLSVVSNTVNIVAGGAGYVTGMYIVWLDCF